MIELVDPSKKYLKSYIEEFEECILIHLEFILVIDS